MITIKTTPLSILRWLTPLGLSLSCTLWSVEAQPPIAPVAPKAEIFSPVADVSTELEAARTAWQQGDRLSRDARRNFAVLEKQEKAYDEASAQFSKALKKNSINPFVHSEYGKFWLARSEFTQARSHLDLARHTLQEERGKRDKDPKYHQRYIFDPEDEADLCRTLGGLLERAAEFPQAEEAYRQAVKLDDKNLKNQLSLATCICAGGRPDEALKLLTPLAEKLEKNDSATVLSPTQAAHHALLMYTVAMCQEEGGRLEDALLNYQRALTLTAKAGVADSMGVEEYALLSMARVEDLLDGMQEHTQQREKENAERLKNNQELLPVLNEHADFAEAAYRCLEGLKLKNIALSDEKFLLTLACTRSDILQSNPDADTAMETQPMFDTFENAMHAFEEAHQKYKPLARAYYELGLCNLMMGRFGAARQHCHAAALYNPNNLAMLNVQGEVLLELGQWDEAASVFKQMLALEAESGVANFGLARALAAAPADLKQVEASLDALDRAEHLGVRDRRIHNVSIVTLKSGRKLEGILLPDSQEHLLVLKMAESTYEIKKEDYLETHKRLGLREQLLDLKDRLERGEKLAKGTVLRGKPHRDHSRDDHSWENTIFQR